MTMASILRISSLIAQLTPGAISPFSGPTSSVPASTGSSSEFGAAVVRQQGDSGSAGDLTPLVYARKDARGLRDNSLAEEKPDVTGKTNGTEGKSVGGSGTETSEASSGNSPKKPSGEFLSKAEMAVVSELKKADQSVRAHEMAHLAAAGGFAKGGATFSYQRGPDGQNYAVGGEVQIDTSKEATPAATIVKMQIIRQAALAPADPSPQDQRVASFATLQIAEASKELFMSRSSLDARPPSSQQAEKDDVTQRDIYQRAGDDLGQQANYGFGSSSSNKQFSAYLPYKQPSGENDKSAVDRIA